MLTTVPAPLVEHLRAQGEAPALITSTGAVSYRELADQVAAAMPRFGEGRRLVGLAMGNDTSSVVLYLAALAGGHAVALGSVCRLGEVIGGVAPSVMADGPRDLVTVTDRTHDLHPDLALLLSTSGSTGSPKLVRLSYDNLHSNAAAIAEYLAIRPSDRAITTLPLHYCYGLSVLHSHLLAGAAVVLTDCSVTDPQFPGIMRNSAVTTLAAVPHTLELLEQTGFPELDLPALRTVTQAGGRMEPAGVRRWAELGQRNGFDLVVMYGQTEATARMLYLPPDLATLHPDAVGVPIPGGSVRLDPVDGAAPGVGELIYRGANVMMGYALDAADLARGAEVGELRTGDLARRNDAGLIEIVGRRSRFAKVFGLRLDLGALESDLADAGVPVWCLEGDGCLLAACLDDPDAVRPLLCRATGLKPAAVVLRQVAEVPRTEGGKPDYPALRELVQQPRPVAATSVAAVYAAVLQRDIGTIGPHDTFVSLGGDSMSYVAAGAALEQLLGVLPTQWHTTAIGQLQPTELPRSRFWRRMDTTVLLRCLAMILIVGSHIGVMDIRGGAHLLIAIAGYNFARFRLNTGAPRTQELRGALTSVARIAVPSAAWLCLVVAVGSEYGPAVLFANNLFGPNETAPEWRYWYVEAVVYVLLAAIALLAVPALHRMQRRNPFSCALALLVAALAVRFLAVAEDGPAELYTPAAVLWLFAAGWALSEARSGIQIAAVLALFLLGMVGYFDDPWRVVPVVAGVLLIVLRPTIRLPWFLAPAVAAVAGASLWIYLTHWQVYPPLQQWGWVALAVSLVAGVAAHRVEGLVRSRSRRTVGAAVPVPA